MNVCINDSIAEVELVQSYSNHDNVPVELFYYLPIEEDAAAASTCSWRRTASVTGPPS